ncbi:MAG: deoxyribodipyrimidine photo-lyase type [Proteobacteria bacterium]|nr:deoxyribodipyrimidine photo-lyase type [Pseudomonadota bacterium]
MNSNKALVWFRRDLRDYDHAALSAALAGGRRVYCAFVFDTDILDALPSATDRRVHFIHTALLELDDALRAKGGGLIVRHGAAGREIAALARELGVTTVFANRDYEPAARQRDAAVAADLRTTGIAFELCKDQVIFEGTDVLTQNGQPFSVFTPYQKAWRKRLSSADYATYPCAGQLAGGELAGVPELGAIGFAASDLGAVGIRPGMSGARQLWDDFRRQGLADYGSQRDFPARRGVSYLSVHLRFGTLSLRRLVGEALAQQADSWLNELIWRDFYFMILDHHPHVVRHAFKPAYDAIRWADWPTGFAAWCNGQTGYPLVDAAMRQLNDCGWMHNRLRMIAASFLCKDLGLDWRLGERYFAERLIDFDLAANNGGWQWAASSGCDAQPYFRIFNPLTQSKKFDPEGQFIRRYLPELAGLDNRHIHAPWLLPATEQQALGVVVGRDYPGPIVDHAQAREATLARYAVVRKPA